jgi:hypothetical protein
VAEKPNLLLLSDRKACKALIASEPTPTLGQLGEHDSASCEFGL